MKNDIMTTKIPKSQHSRCKSRVIRKKIPENASGKPSVICGFHCSIMLLGIFIGSGTKCSLLDFIS